MPNGCYSYNHLGDLTQRPITLLTTERFRRRNLSKSLRYTLDRVNVLGDDSTNGHTGCVNALSWARDGELLLSGGDDATVRIWAINAADTSREYPFTSRSVIQTGHRANIFSAQMLPHSSRIATVAGDKQVRVFDIGEDGLVNRPNGRETVYSSRQACTHIIRCHSDRVKRIVTEHSPDLFLSVAEDGSVRQHDLRSPHDCHNGLCPSPLVKVNHELSTLALSSLTPYQFVVAGNSPYGYLFDRRNTGRLFQEEWGLAFQGGEEGSLTRCVRRLGRPKKNTSERVIRSENITGARMSAYNGHEVLLSYSGDAVYLYSTVDDIESKDSMASSSPSLLASNPKRRKVGGPDVVVPPNPSEPSDMDDDSEMSSGTTVNVPQYGDDNVREDSDDDAGGDEFVDFSAMNEDHFQPHAPVIYPRLRFSGARNVATVKDVNFLGPYDELVASGSDDGNFFVWHKGTGALHGIYEGDSSVVNMIEGHPHLPLVAVSGIDTTVKLFAPADGPSTFSRIGNAEQIVETNTRISRTRIIRYTFAALLAEARLAVGSNEIDIPECQNQ